MITTTAVIGSGYMGGGIAQVLALAGCTVRLADVSAEIAESNYQRIVDEARQFEESGLFPAGAAAAVQENVSPAASIEEAVEGVDFIEEAVPETIPIKRETLARVSAAASPDQSSEKSPLPRFSIAARSGSTAPVASGNAGATALIGPCSRMKRVNSPRAGRPVITLVITVESSRAWASAVRAGAITLDSRQRR